MFDIFLYPVSAILWFWHTIFGAVLSPSSGLAWALAVVFLVFTLRVLLVKPALSQLRSARKNQRLAPKIAKIRERYRDDKQRMVREVQKLHADNGTSMLGGCLPALLQLPVFLSLYWVLRGFTPDAESNQVFDRAGVESFLNADIFGAKLGNWLSQPAADLAAFGTDRAHMIAVGLPLMLIAGVATFLSLRMSMRRSTTTSPQLATASRIMLYLAPAGVLFSGWFFPMPIAVLLYILANNVWTFGQQHFLSGVVDQEEERTAASKPKPQAPKPGQKPKRTR